MEIINSTTLFLVNYFNNFIGNLLMYSVLAFPEEAIMQQPPIVLTFRDLVVFSTFMSWSQFNSAVLEKTIVASFWWWEAKPDHSFLLAQDMEQRCWWLW